MKISHFYKKLSITFLFLCLFGLLGVVHSANKRLLQRYEDRESVKILDRNEKLVTLLPNEDGLYVTYINDIPESLKTEIISSEDRFFKFHPGINPVSTIGALLNFRHGGGSTITQQLVKILLNHENKRTFIFKLEEMFYALAMEIKFSKDEIITMYLNSIYFGNKVSGIERASQLYFDTTPSLLKDDQIRSLINTIPSPSEHNPWSENEDKTLKKKFHDTINPTDNFEISKKCEKKICHVTNDIELTSEIRELVINNLVKLSDKHATHAAVVIFKEPEHELIAMVGSPYPDATTSGSQINMALQPRPIGSTVKPFIYALGFEKGLRPYTLVDDREYKFTTGAGFAHYPKNFDYKYRGIVSLHESLSNSLNVPAVKVLEYVTLNTFEKFMLSRVGVTPLQPISTYQYGVALGQMEINLLTLTHLFSIFANDGVLHGIDKNEMPKRIFKSEYVQLINAILSDRLAGIDQFGLNGDLNVELTSGHRNIALKTGTSREFHDSWVVGYTPDFVVGVWVGNTDNTAMDDVTGQIGAGTIWHDVMSHIFKTNYNKNTQFKSDALSTFTFNDSSFNGILNGLQFGLKNDKPEAHINLLNNKEFILQPHDGDEFQFTPGVSLILEASEAVEWKVNDEFVGNGKMVTYFPSKSGEISIAAKTGNNESKINILLTP